MEIGEQVGEMRVIKSGLTGNDRVIIDGLLRAIPGREVTPEEAGKPAAAPSANGAAPKSAGWQPSRRPSMISTFFINRPIFANVIAIVTILLGAVALVNLPVAQYPEIVPPTIQVTTNYPGGSADVVANTVGIPIEQAVNGVEGSIYMQSTSGSDGSYTLTVSFNVGTDLNTSLSLVQNAVNGATAQLPPGGSEPGRDRQEGFHQHPDVRQPLFGRRPLRREIPQQLRHHQSPAARLPACPAWARSTSSEPAPTACASGSTRTRCSPTD